MEMKRVYLRVVIVWSATLAALFLFQRFFTQ
jgi:hypothetical protein